MLRSSSLFRHAAVPATVGMLLLGLGKEDDEDDQGGQQQRPSRNVAHASR